ncbi:ANTAR domain-containing protein [Arthrobacter sp. TMN-37]
MAEDEGAAPTQRVGTLLQDMVLDSTDVEEFLTEVVKLAAATLEVRHGETLCGVTLLRPRRSATVASSSEYARQMDEIQYNFDDGPCLRAAREEKLVHVTDITQDTRFPDYRDAIADHGIRSILGIPILLEGDANAGLNLYSDTVDAFDDDAIAAAESFADEASKALRLAVRMARLTESANDLKAAMESRTTIDLAVGIIMGQNRCSQDEAFGILQSASNSRNMKLRDVAAAIVASTGNSTPKTHFEA